MLMIQAGERQAALNARTSFPSGSSKVRICNWQSPSSGWNRSHTLPSTFATKALFARLLDSVPAMSCGVVTPLTPSLVVPSGRVTRMGTFSAFAFSTCTCTVYSLHSCQGKPSGCTVAFATPVSPPCTACKQLDLHAKLAKQKIAEYEGRTASVSRFLYCSNNSIRRFIYPCMASASSS
jgi:hypothetical protein